MHGGAGVPFRETHHLSGAAVKLAEDRGCTMFDLTHADLAQIHPMFEEDVVEVSRTASLQQSCLGCAESPWCTCSTVHSASPDASLSSLQAAYMLV